MERFLDYFAPDRYELDLKINRRHEVLGGTVRVSGVVKAETIKFHAVNIQIKSVRYFTQGSSIDSQGTACDFTYHNDELSIPVTTAMAPGFYHSRQHPDELSFDYDNMAVLLIQFETKIQHNMQGCYMSSYEHNGKQKRIVATQFESHYAREAFPCVDEPAAKAEFRLDLEVEDLQPEDVVLANTPCQSQYDHRFHFETTPRMSTYLLAWVIGPLQSVSTVNNNGVKVSSYCALGMPIESLLFANETAARALEYYDEKFQEKYPLPKLDQVALPDFEAGAMENWGLVTYRESMMLANPSASNETKQSIALTITHELSHQWFGNLVTMQWWDDLWLNESFASVIEYFATAALYPKFNVWQDFFTGYCFAALKRDCLPGVQSVQQAIHNPAEIATLFDSAIVYAKGAHLIFMLIRLMGEEKFFQGICYYFDRYKYDNTVGDDLWSALQLYADFDIKDFMHAWITQPGYPVLCRQGNEWQQQRFFITGDTDNTTWPLPDVTDDMSGHYLIKLSDAEFQAKIADFEQLSNEQKLRLLIDYELLAKTPDVASSALLDLLPKFTYDTSAAVWNILATLISDLKLFCPPNSVAEENYKMYLRQLLQAQFDDIDYSANHDVDSTTRRDILLGLARYAEYEPVLRRLLDFYQDDLLKIDSELRPAVMRAKLYFDESEVFEPWLALYQDGADPEVKDEILYTLASVAKQSEHLDRMLGLLEQPEIVRPQDHIFLFLYLMRNSRTRDRALDWLVTHWDYVERLTGEKSIEDYPRYAAGVICNPEEAKKFYDFFDTMADDPILSRTLKIAHTDIDARLALIAKDSAGVQDKLKELVKEK